MSGVRDDRGLAHPFDAPRAGENRDPAQDSPVGKPDHDQM
jgi:hypothetical protein